MDSKRKIRKRQVRQVVFARDSYKCQLCNWKPIVPLNWDGSIPLTDGYRTLTIDHVIEKSLGGPSVISNFRTACDRCNVKRSIHVSKLIRQGQLAGLNLLEARKMALGLIYPERCTTVPSYTD